MREDDGHRKVIEPVTDDTSIEALTLEFLREEIADVLKILTYREREVLMLRYGLSDGYPYTLEQIGGIFKVTKERIRQIEATAIGKLRKRTKTGPLRRYAEESA
jgi:RNA polymerase primary sigma factor